MLMNLTRSQSIAINIKNHGNMNQIYYVKNIKLSTLFSFYPLSKQAYHTQHLYNSVLPLKNKQMNKNLRGITQIHFPMQSLQLELPTSQVQQYVWQ